MSQIDPILLATVTSGATTLALESVKSMVGEAGKDAWKGIKGLLGLTEDPPIEELAPTIATKLSNDPELLEKVKDLLSDPANGTAGQLIGSVMAKNVFAAQVQHFNNVS